MEKIISLKKGDTMIEDHIAKYKVLLCKSKIPEDSPPPIDYLIKSLPTALQQDILQLPTLPKDLKEWYTWANQLDNNFRKMQHILE